MELGYTYLETDVHVTQDGVLLAFHDTVLDRVTDRTGHVGESTYAEVQAGFDYPDEGVPEARLKEPLERALRGIDDLLATAEAGRLSRDGARL